MPKIIIDLWQCCDRHQHGLESSYFADRLLTSSRSGFSSAFVSDADATEPSSRTGSVLNINARRQAISALKYNTAPSRGSITVRQLSDPHPGNGRVNKTSVTT